MSNYDTAKIFGDLKEYIDYFKNIWNKGLTTEEACSDYRKKNPSFPKKYW